MKILIYIAFLITLAGCNDNSKAEFANLHVLSDAHKERITLSDSVFKYVKYTADVIALTNATFYDGNGNPAKENQTILVVDGYFKSVGLSSEVEIPEEATIINLEEKTVMPGIIGVHNHLHFPQMPFTGDIAAKMYLASGVTTIQTCGAASPQKEIELSANIEKGLNVGPNIVTSGPYFTGEGGNPNMIIPRDEKHIRDTIKYWADKGVSWFKAYRNTQPEDLKIIVSEAHKQNAKVTGHLCSITFEEASIIGIDGIEHGLNSTSDFRKNKTYGVCDGSRGYIDELDIENEEVEQLLKLMIDKNVFLTSTLAIYEASIPNRAFANEKTLKIMSPSLRSQYREIRKLYDSIGKEDNIREERLKRIMQFERKFFLMGGRLTAGVDAGRHVLPGFGDQRNFELLLEAGFSKEEVIQIMTSNGAKVLSNPEIGSIKIGKRADFLILGDNLEDSPEHIKNIEIVFKNGYGFDPKLILNELEGAFGNQ